MTKPTWTNQEVFDKVATHLLKQGKKAYNTKMQQCLYFAEDGSKCAVGCLIAADQYSEKLEGELVTDVVVYSALVFQPTQDQIVLLRHLQAIHDGADPKLWKDQMKILAIYKNLDPSILQKV